MVHIHSISYKLTIGMNSIEPVAVLVPCKSCYSQAHISHPLKGEAKVEGLGGITGSYLIFLFLLQLKIISLVR